MKRERTCRQAARGSASERAVVLVALPMALLSLYISPALALEMTLPAMQFSLDGVGGPEQVSSVLQIIFLLTVLTLAPALMIMTTSFTRLAVVLALLRQAMGTQQSPPNQVVVGLALFLTFFIMQPIWDRIYQEALVPYQNMEISGEEFLERSALPMRDFMLKQTSKKDLALFMSFSTTTRPARIEDVSLLTLIPAFVISELKTAFQIGFLLYIPFIILDMVVASVLLSMGMMMLPPVMISLPFKLMLFILVDGWNVLIGSLVRSFH